MNFYKHLFISKKAKGHLTMGLFLIVIVCCLSCSKFLEEKPNSVITSANFYQTASDALLAVNAAYDHLGSGTSNSDFGGVYFNNFWALQALASDNGKSGLPDPNSVQLAEFSHDASNTFIKDIWEDCYKTINLTNIALKHIPNIEMDESLKNRYLGECSFIRGLMYFELARLFGGVILLTEPTEDLSSLTIERSSLDEVYTQIISDLEFAESSLPYSYEGADKGRATKGSAGGYLAKAYLTLKDYSKARDKLNTIISAGVHQLMPDFADIFKIANTNNPEVLFSINFTFNNNAIWETSQFNVRTLPLALNRNSLAWEVPTLDVYNNYEDGDRRKEVTFQTTFTEADGRVLTFDPHIFKFWDQEAEPSASSSGSDFFNLRYADVLLMFAEAESELNNGPTAEAYEAVNQVRRRARFANGDERSILNDLAGLNQQDFRKAVWLERRRELVWEGHRWYDLVRQNQLKERVEIAKPGVAVDENKHVLFPIPQREININPNLSQNPGY